MVLQSVIDDLADVSNPEKAALLSRFFQTFPGGYGEGDQFIGVVVPKQRMIAKKYFKQINLPEIESLLRDAVHERRMTALFMLTYKYEKSDEVEKQAIVDLYLRNTTSINNWDLVDCSAHKILGHYLFDKDRAMLYQLAKSKNLWEQRIAVISTFYFIGKRQYDDAIKISKILLYHPHDLIHKAVGWMLREIGNRDYEVEYRFLAEYYHDMPRTMLRYAIEKFAEPVRQAFLKGTI